MSHLDLPFGAEVAIRQGRRYPVMRVFRKTTEVTVDAGLTLKKTIVEQRMPRGHHGFLTAVGQETTGAGWANLLWRIVVDNAPVPGFGRQTGIQWGFIDKPGEVFAWIPNGSIVKLVVDNPAGAPAALTRGALVGYWWPEDEPES